MSEFLKVEFVKLPEACVIGKEYRVKMADVMSPNNPLGGFWDECWSDGTFDKLSALEAHLIGDNTVGFMADWAREDGMFSYWIGVLVTADCPQPEGFARYTIPACEVAVGYNRGNDVGDVCSDAHANTQKALEAAGRTCEKMEWSMEYYQCPRFTTPDAEGKITLDYYIPCD